MCRSVYFFCTCVFLKLELKNQTNLYEHWLHLSTTMINLNLIKYSQQNVFLGCTEQTAWITVVNFVRIKHVKGITEAVCMAVKKVTSEVTATKVNHNLKSFNFQLKAQVIFVCPLVYSFYVCLFSVSFWFFVEYILILQSIFQLDFSHKLYLCKGI